MNVPRVASPRAACLHHRRLTAPVTVTPSRDEAPSIAAASRPIGSRDVARIAGLVAGDAVAFLVFAAVGRGSHHEATGLGAMADVVVTAAPFAIAWFVVAPFVGVYRRSRTATTTAMLVRTALAWLASWPAALLLRWAFTGRVPPLSFALVTLIANLVFLSIWRGLFAAVASFRRGRAAWR
jgi:Protein of unknown function (DUF3054)